MTTPVVKLIKGARTLDLNDRSKYRLGSDFVPPSINSEPDFAQGSSANLYDGASLVSRRAANRGWSFSVNVIAASENEMARAIADIQHMLNWAGDSSEPLYIKYRSNSDMAYEPLWGQDGWLFYQIEHGVASVGGEYAETNRRATNVFVRLDLIIRPYALGLRQRLASATGGVLEDTVGAADGQSRGLIIAESTTNKMTNPIFGHATWNNGWTADAAIIAAQNTDPEFLLFGISSAKVTRTTGATLEFQQSIAAGNTNTHILSCYAKRPDGAAVTSADVVLYYNATLTTTYTSVGNGWYRLSASVTGIAAATDTGIRPAAIGRTVYVDGFQLEEASYISPLVYGDLLGCSWNGTAHASTSTRGTGRVRVASADSFSIAQGTVRAVVKFPYDNTFTDRMYIYQQDAGDVRLFFFPTDDAFHFDDGTNSYVTAAQTFSADTIFVFHAVYGPTGMTLYINGVATAATGATYTPPGAGTYLYIGSDNTIAYVNNLEFYDFTTFDRAMSAAEVAADYANVTQVAAHEQRIGAIPWLWSSDGDDDVVNHNDTDANDDNYVVCGGIPGSVPAATFISGRTSTGWSTDPTMFMWLMDSDEFIDPIEMVNDLSGTAAADASGGAYQAVSITTAATAFTKAASSTQKYLKALAGREMGNLVRLYDAGSNLQITTTLAAPTPVVGDYKSLATAAASRLYLSPFVAIQDSPPGFFDYSVSPAGFTPGINLKRSTGTASVQIDYAMAVTRPFLTFLAASTLGEAGFYYQGRRASTYDDAAAGSPYKYPLLLQGDAIEFVPHKHNILLTLMGDATHNPTIATVLTYAKVIVTPRWGLL